MTNEEQAKALLSATRFIRSEVATGLILAHDDAIRRECAEKQSQTFRVLATVLKDLKDDWRVVAGVESIQYIRAENAERVAREAAIGGNGEKKAGE